jgi:hypothetical protein
MNQWDNHFPPLNLWNYSLFHEWIEDFEKEFVVEELLYEVE